MTYLAATNLPGTLGVLHVLLALGSVAAYAMVPFTALRRLPITRRAAAAGLVFFASCALGKLAVAFGAEESPWLIVVDAAQLGSFLVLLHSLCRQVSWTLARRRERMEQLAALGERGGEDEGPP